MGNILSILSGVFKLFNKLADYFAKKDMENQIKNQYEQEKKIDALEEDKRQGELIDEANEKFDAAKDEIKNVSDVNIADADLTDVEIKNELDGISDPDERKNRKQQIDLAKEIKETADKKKKEVENDETFNSGDEFTFKG